MRHWPQQPLFMQYWLRMIIGWETFFLRKSWRCPKVTNLKSHNLETMYNLTCVLYCVSTAFYASRGSLQQAVQVEAEVRGRGRKSENRSEDGRFEHDHRKPDSSEFNFSFMSFDLIRIRGHCGDCMAQS